jgi:thiol:disulfide interchange protein DsbD
MLTQIFSVFGAGILSSLSPCVYPMIPITLGYLGLQKVDQNSKIKIILFFLGQVVAFTAIGLVAVQLGETFGFTSQNTTVNKVIGFVLIVFGLFSFFNYVPGFLLNLNSKTQFNFISKDKFIFPFVIGVSSALVASPCSSPILGSVLTTLASSGDFSKGIILMVAYSVGASLIFLVLGLGLLKAQNLPRAGHWMNLFHKVSSVLILCAGGYYLYLGFFDN